MLPSVVLLRILFSVLLVAHWFLRSLTQIILLRERTSVWELSVPYFPHQNVSIDKKLKDFFESVLSLDLGDL